MVKNIKRKTGDLVPVERNYKRNSEYFLGVGSNYNQDLLKEGKKIIPKKNYSLEQIKNFYQTLLGYESLSKEVKNSIIFFGGTVPYILCNETGITRNFGDVDIFMSVSMMKRFRYELRKELNYIYDSIEFTRHVRFTGKGFCIESTSCCKKEIESYDESNRIMNLEEMEVEKNSDYQDYGFKAVLFGINISVFPLYNWNFEDGSIGVCTKSFKISKEIGDWNFWLHKIVSKGITIDNFYSEVCILGHNAKVVNTEYIIASKMNAIKFGYILRKDTDEADLKYIEAHRIELGIDEEKVKFFMENIPDYGISFMYRITRTYNVQEMSPKAIATRNVKTS